MIRPTDPAPSDRYAAADWLFQRHARVQYLAARLDAGCRLDGDTGFDPDVLAQAVHEADEHKLEWHDWERRNPPPRGDYDDGRYEAWVNSGPQPTPGAARFLPMSSGEKTQLRLLATLGQTNGPDAEHNYPTRGAAWGIEDVTNFDRAGAAILADWLAIVRAQLPATLYPPDGPRQWIDTGSGAGWSPL